MPLPAYVINLDRRRDRWAFMSAQLDELGIAATRIPAVDARLLVASEWRNSLGGQAGILSLTKALIDFLGSGAPGALMLEDDVELATGTPALLDGVDWWPAGAHAVRLDSGTKRQSRPFWRPSGRTPTGRMLQRLEQQSVGAGAFLIDRRGARIALRAFANPHAGTDTMLFNLVRSEAARKLGTVQIAPAMAQQLARFDSDQAEWREQWKAERPRRRPKRSTARQFGKWCYLLRLAALRAGRKVRNQDVPYSETPPL